MRRGLIRGALRAEGVRGGAERPGARAITGRARAAPDANGHAAAEEKGIDEPRAQYENFAECGGQAEEGEEARRESDCVPGAVLQIGVAIAA